MVGSVELVAYATGIPERVGLKPPQYGICTNHVLYSAGFRPGDVVVVMPRERVAVLEQIEALSRKLLTGSGGPEDLDMLLALASPALHDRCRG